MLVIPTTNFVKLAAEDVPRPKYNFTPQETVEYNRLDAIYKQHAKQRDDFDHQLYLGLDLTPQQKQELESKKEFNETKLHAVGDLMFRLCEKARNRKPGQTPVRKPVAKGQKWLNTIVRNFGYTSNPDEAGYIHTNGKLIDFSGRRRGNAQAGNRAQDHREVASYIPELGIKAEDARETGSRSHAMRTFMMHSGAIRLMHSPFDAYVDMAAVPTKQQLNKILQLCKNKRNEVGIEAKLPRGQHWQKVLRPDAPDRPVSLGKVQEVILQAIQFLKHQQGQP